MTPRPVVPVAIAVALPVVVFYVVLVGTAAPLFIMSLAGNPHVYLQERDWVELFAFPSSWRPSRRRSPRGGWSVGRSVSESASLR
jgi:hypothetical protein